MKLRELIILGSLLIIFWTMGIAADVSKKEWVFVVGITALGMVVFDSYQTITARWANIFGFMTSVLLTGLGCLAPSSEYFFAYISGAFLVSAFSFEQNSPAWSGESPLKSPVFGAVIFLICAMARGLPFLSPEQVLIFDLMAFGILLLSDLFGLLRENSELLAGSFVQGVRVLVTGVSCLFYIDTYMPEIARGHFLLPITIAVCVLGVFVAALNFFVQDVRRGHILFVTGWLLFIAWAGFSSRNDRLFIALAAVIILAWSTMSSCRRHPSFSSIKEIFLRLSAWGIPGSLLFSMLVFLMAPSQDPLVQRGAVVWLAVFFIQAAALSRQEWRKSPEKELAWGWRQSLAMFLNLLGAGLLAGVKMFPQVFNYLRGV